MNISDGAVEAGICVNPGWFTEGGAYTPADLSEFSRVDFKGKVIMVTNHGAAGARE